MLVVKTPPCLGLCRFHRRLSVCTKLRNSTRGTVRLAFKQYGDISTQNTNPLVILHGLFGQKSNWNSVAKALQRRLRNQIFAVDLRNHGDSDWSPSTSYHDMSADLEAFLRERVLTPLCVHQHSGVSLLGHSMGGKAAMLLALTHSKLINRLIIEDIAPKHYNTPMHRSVFPRYIECMMNMDLNGWEDCEDISEVRKRADAELQSVVEGASVRAFLLTNLRRKDGLYSWSVNLESLSDGLTDIVNFPHVGDNNQYLGPTLAISGDLSNYVEAADGATFHKLFPKCHFETIVKAGHWIHADNPADFINSVVRFCQDSVT